VRAVGADQVGRFGFEAFSENADVPIRLDPTNRGAGAKLGAGALRLFEKERIEAFAHDHVGEGCAGIADEPLPAPESDIEKADGIFDDGIDREGEEALGAERNAASAGLVPWELGTVQDKDTSAAGREFASGGAAGGAGANDDGIESGHRARL